MRPPSNAKSLRQHDGGMETLYDFSEYSIFFSQVLLSQDGIWTHGYTAEKKIFSTNPHRL
jgi:hypothetical protein